MLRFQPQILVKFTLIVSDSNTCFSSRFSITYFDGDFDCDPDDHEGGVRRRCLQSSLHIPLEDRRTDAEFSLLTCQKSEFYPAGYDQMGMLHSMVSHCSGVSMQPASPESTGASSSAAAAAQWSNSGKRSRGKRSRTPGGAKDSSRCKIPHYDWVGDGDFQKMYEMQVSSSFLMPLATVVTFH